MNKTPICPFLKKPCIQHECMMYSHMTMVNPQTGMPFDQDGCSIAFLPLLMLESANQTRHVQAAVESTRNEITKRQDVFNQLALDARKGPTLIE